MHRTASSRAVPRLILKGKLGTVIGGRAGRGLQLSNHTKHHSFVAPAIVPGNMVAEIEGGLRAPLIRRERGALRPDWNVITIEADARGARTRGSNKLSSRPIASLREKCP
jgi:hypothetical protein